MTEFTSPSPEESNETKELTLYGLRGIGGASYLGGPIAASYLISENLKALGNPEKAKRVFFLGFIFTILMFTVLFALPDAILERIPNFLLPLSYTLAYYYYAQAQFGPQLERHKALGNTFYSGWRVAGIGLIFLVIMSAITFGMFLFSETAVPEAYQIEMDQFTANETKTLDFYDHLQSDPPFKLLQEIEDVCIPLWEENIEIIERCLVMDDLGLEGIFHTQVMLDYSKARLEIFQTFQLALMDPSKDYGAELDELHNQLDVIMAKLE